MKTLMNTPNFVVWPQTLSAGTKMPKGILLATHVIDYYCTSNNVKRLYGRWPFSNVLFNDASNDDDEPLELPLQINILRINISDSSINFYKEFPREQEQGALNGEMYHSSKIKREGRCREKRRTSYLRHHSTAVHTKTWEALRRFLTQCSYTVVSATSPRN
jgi:hypothetical protein